MDCGRDARLAYPSLTPHWLFSGTILARCLPFTYVAIGLSVESLILLVEIKAEIKVLRAAFPLSHSANSYFF